MFSPNVEEVSILKRVLVCLLKIFFVSRISLILSLFLSSSRFFVISGNFVIGCDVCWGFFDVMLFRVP